MGFPVAAAIGAGVSLAGMAIARGKDRRQLEQQRKLQDLNIEGQKQLMEEQYKMWERTGYGGQMAQMKKAGLNPALLYGMGGGGGQSMGNAGSATGAHAASGSGNEIESAMGLGLQTHAQLALLKAQKENIEADTENKRSNVPVNQTQANLNTANTEGKNIENALRAYLNNMTPEGEAADNTGNSIAVQQEKARLRRENADITYRLDQNEREELMNSKQLQAISADIINMGKEGKKIDEIIENLKKEGKLLDIEIKFNDWGFDKADVGKFINGLAHQLIGRYLGGGRGGKK